LPGTPKYRICPPTTDFNHYTWDGYGNLASANGAAITYDALDRMVENDNGSYQLTYSPGGTQPLATFAGQTLEGTHILLPGGAMAIYNSSGLQQYNHPDWLGSAKLFSSPTRTAQAAMSYAPFGEGYAGGIFDIQFTSYSSAYTVPFSESQSGTLDDFTYRRYAPVQGRWISPDPAGLAAVDPTNPQTWNRYAYVMNQPFNFTDPSGLCSQVTTTTTTVSLGQNTTISVSSNTTPLWPGPCAAPPAGCMWISAGGSGEGSQWTGMQCGSGGAPVIQPDCPPSGCPSGGGGGGAITGPPTPLTSQQLQEVQNAYTPGTFAHPSKQACGRINKKAKADALVAGGSAAIGFLFPPSAVVTEPVAAGEGLVAVGEEAYMAFFCE
jgi:RHS repeat-associated protein